MRADSIPPDVLTQVFVRRRASDLARYGFHWNGDPGNSRLEIKFDGVPTPQTRILAQVNAPPTTPGDALRLEASGTDPVILRAYHNGALVLEAADAAPNRITIAGHVGMVARLRQGGTAPPAAPVFASWAGGSLAAAALEDARTPEHAPALTAAPSPFAAAVALRAPGAAGESLDIVTPLGRRVRRLVLDAGGPRPLGRPRRSGGDPPARRLLRAAPQPGRDGARGQARLRHLTARRSPPPSGA